MPHTWTYKDDVLVFYLYRYDNDNLISLESVSRFIGFDYVGSVRMRIQNFKACDGNGGLQNYGQLTKRVYDEYHDVNREIHRKECLEIMQIPVPTQEREKKKS